MVGSTFRCVLIRNNLLSLHCLSFVVLLLDCFVVEMFHELQILVDRLDGPGTRRDVPCRGPGTRGDVRRGPGTSQRRPRPWDVPGRPSRKCDMWGSAAPHSSCFTTANKVLSLPCWPHGPSMLKSSSSSLSTHPAPTTRTTLTLFMFGVRVARFRLGLAVPPGAAASMSD